MNTIVENSNLSNNIERDAWGGVFFVFQVKIVKRLCKWFLSKVVY